MDNHQLSPASDGTRDAVDDPLGALDDWDSFRSLGHRIVDDLTDYLSTLRERPIVTPLTRGDIDVWDEPVPQHPTSPSEVYELVRDRLFHSPLGNLHPRYWGWADGSGIPLAALANLLASALNPNVEGMDHSACFVEKQVVRWCATLFGLPNHASGLLVSGTSTANLLAMTIARAVAIRTTHRTAGSDASSLLTFYGSTEAHASVRRAIVILGQEPSAFRAIDTRPDGTMNTDLLRDSIERDRLAGQTPACVVATIGTTTTGAIDDLNSILEITRQHGVWLHVDGAYGALASLAPSGAHLLSGIENVDSLAFDLHKWPYLPFGVGCLLTTHPTEHLNTFAIDPEYLQGFPVPPGTDQHAPFSSLGIETSREFRALRVWMCMRAYGIRTFSTLIERNLEQARYLRGQIAAQSAFELIAPSSLNVVCFRWRGQQTSDYAQSNTINRRILESLHRRPRIVVSGAVFKGLFVLRAAIFNHRSTFDDVDCLLDVIRQEAAVITGADP